MKLWGKKKITQRELRLMAIQYQKQVGDCEEVQYILNNSIPQTAIDTLFTGRSIQDGFVDLIMTLHIAFELGKAIEELMNEPETWGFSRN